MKSSEDSKNRTYSEFFKQTDQQYFSELTLQDIDEAVINWLKNYKFRIFKQDGNLLDVPVEFIASERWNLAEIEKGILDKNRKSDLPVVNILRTKSTPNRERYVFRHKDTNTVIIQTPLKEMSADFLRKYNISTPTPNINKTVYQIISIPHPIFFDIDYSIKILTNFISHTNQIIEQLYGENIFIWVPTNKKYGFQGILSEPISQETTLDNKERLFINEITLSIKAYIIRKNSIEKPKVNYVISENPTRTNFKEFLLVKNSPPLGKISPNKKPQVLFVEAIPNKLETPTGLYETFTNKTFNVNTINWATSSHATSYTIQIEESEISSPSSNPTYPPGEEDPTRIFEMDDLMYNDRNVSSSLME